MAIVITTVADRQIDNMDINRLVLARKSYFPFWDGQGNPPVDTGTVSIVGGATSMTWFLYSSSGEQMNHKHLIVEGENVADEDVAQALIDAGWITQDDNVEIT